MEGRVTERAAQAASQRGSGPGADAKDHGVAAVPGFDSHTSYLKENNGMKGNGAPRALGARESRFDSDLPDCPVL